MFRATPPVPRPGPLDGRDARAKLVPLLIFLAAVSTARRAFPESAAALALLLAAVCLWARVPLLAALRRAALVLPFCACFAIACWLGGDLERGLTLGVKSYLSCLAVWVVVATTPLPRLVAGLEGLGAPRFLLVVAQFIYRYLFVISGEARQMAQAALARRGSVRAFGRLRFRAAAGALAVLFARSYRRAGEVHHAMLARGFRGRIPGFVTPRFRAGDAVFLGVASLAPVLVRLAAERWA